MEGVVTAVGEKQIKISANGKEYVAEYFPPGIKIGDTVTFTPAPWGGRATEVQKALPKPKPVEPKPVEPKPQPVEKPKPTPVAKPKVVEPPKKPSPKASTVSPQVVKCEDVLLKLKVIVKDGLTLKVIAGADVKLNDVAPAKKTAKDGSVTFDVKQDSSNTVKATKLRYSTSKREPHDEATVEVAKENPPDQTLYLTVTDKLLVIGEGTDFGYAAALANRYSPADKLKQVIATQYPQDLVTGRPGSAPANLVNYDVEFNVITPDSWTTAALETKYGPDFSDFEAIIFNNPHYGYGAHKGMVLGVVDNNYPWLFAHTMEYDGYDDDTFDQARDTTGGGSLPDFSTEPATDRDFGDLFERSGGYRGPWENYTGRYNALISTMGFNDYLVRKFIENGRACLRAGGTVELNGSNSYEDRLARLGFSKAAPWIWEGPLDASHPYYANYTAQHTHPRWHPSWTQFRKEAPRPPQLRNMRRYIVTK